MNEVNPSAQNRVFAYGTLILPEIWELVTRSNATATAATLAGYRRFRVRDADYPGILATGDDSEDRVDGFLYSDLSSTVMRRLDSYEDVFYQRVEVCVETAENDSVDCQTYVVPPSRKEVLSSDDWDLEWFRNHAQRRFLDRLGLGD